MSSCPVIHTPYPPLDRTKLWAWSVRETGKARLPVHKVDPSNPLPRYYQVYLSLEGRIRQGEIRPGETLPSERQLAVDYGVSRITIVKSLDLLVQDGLIERRHGRGNFVLGQPEEGDCGLDCRVAFCVPEPSESYIFAIVRGATRVAMRHGIDLQVVETGDGEDEVEKVRLLRDRGIDGLILFSRSAYLNQDLYRDLLQLGYPFVMVDRYCPEVHPDVVVFDDEGAGYELTKALIRQGHRRIAMLAGTETFATSVKDRMLGYRRALEEFGLPYDERWVGTDLDDVLGVSLEDPDELKGRFVTFLDWMHTHGPTGVVAVNNYLAERANAVLTRIQIVLMQAVIEAQTPDVDYALDVSLTSITHRPLMLDVAPPVALAWQSGEVLGEKSMEMLVERLGKETTALPRIVRIPMEIRELVPLPQ